MKLNYYKIETRQDKLDQGFVYQTMTSFDDRLDKYYHDFETIYREFDLYTTRFNSSTYHEMSRFKENNEMDDSVSLYGVSYAMPASVPQNKCLFVLEMNNTTNQIMGIGLIKNALAKNQELEIYSTTKNNAYIYKSNFHVQLRRNDDFDMSKHSKKYRSEFHDYVNEEFREFVENILEPTCFMGKSHLKRGGSISRYPMKKMTRHVLFMVLKLFADVDPNGFKSVVLKKFKIENDH